MRAGLDDTPAGWARYLEYLGWLQEDDAGKKSLEFEQMSKSVSGGMKLMFFGRFSSGTSSRKVLLRPGGFSSLVNRIGV